jgi:hypothetical protein
MLGSLVSKELLGTLPRKIFGTSSFTEIEQQTAACLKERQKNRQQVEKGL